jgi:hypothetical protein
MLGGSQLRQQYRDVETSMSFLPAAYMPSASRVQTAAISAVTPSVFCKTSSRIRSTARRRSNGDVNELIPSVFYMLGTDGSHLQRRLSVSVPPCRGFKPNQVGARKNLVLSMPVMNLLRSTSMCCSLALLAILSSHML